MRIDVVSRRASEAEEAFIDDLFFDHGIAVGFNAVSRFPEMFEPDTT